MSHQANNDSLFLPCTTMEPPFLLHYVHTSLRLIIYQTHNVAFKKYFSNVTDVTSVLEVTVMDEKKSEVAGKISIFLLKICNGKKQWYGLKDNTLRERAKGNNPKILLEMNLHWNLVSKK